MTEQQYLDSLAIYNPNGGYRAGKIYDVRDTDNTTPYDLIVTGGGGTRTNAAGNIEGIIRNQLIHSSDFSNAIWTKGSGVTVDSTNNANPINGNLDASKITIPGSTAGVYQKITTSIPAGIRPTVSIWVKADVATTINLALNGATAGGNNKADQLNVTTTWQRISFQINETVVDTGLFFIVGTSSNTGAAAIGDSRTIYIWGAQLELGDISSYQHTVNTITPPKIDHSTGKAAFLFEKAKTNRVTRSNDFTDNVWIKQSGFSITANQTISPDGTNNASLLTGTGNSGFGMFHTGGSYSGISTMSIWVKAVDGVEKTVYLADPNSTSTVKACTVTAQWTRIFLTEDNGINGKGIWLRGVDSTGIYIYEAQVESGELSTNIPTTTSEVTRTSTLNKTSIPATIPKSIFLDTEITNISADKILHNFYNAAAAGQYFFQAKIDAAGDLVVGVLNNYNNSTGNTSGVITLGLTQGRHKFMFCYTSDLEMKVFVDGVEYTINMTCCGLPNNLDTLSIGSQSTGDTTNHFNDSMYDIRVWSTDERAQGITLTTL